MLKAIIVDDELKSRESLRDMLRTFCDGIDVVALCPDVAAGKRAINEMKPNVVFLDVQMQGETGFDLLEELDRIDFEIIFTTAYSEYAIKAIKFSAIDYLLKPIDSEELQAAIKKAKKRHDDPHIVARIQQLLQNTRIANPNQFKLAIPTIDRLIFIKINDIICMRASGSYTEIYMNDGHKFLVSRHLKEYDVMLSGQNFFRIHNSILVNIDEIKSYVRGDGGYVIMSDNSSLDVSRRKKDAFLERIGYKS